jgi:MFS family permease
MRTAAMLAGAIGGFEASSSFFLYPAIKTSIANGDAAAASWFLTITGIVGAAVLLQAGRPTDRYGHHRLFTVGATGFVVATALAVAAPTLVLLIVARGLQSLAQAVMGPSSIAMLVANSRPEERSTELARFAAATGAAGMFGPVLTAVLIESVSWRAAIAVLIPLGVVTAWLVRSARTAAPHVASAAAAPLDVVGSLSVMVGLGALVLALVKANAWGWTSGRVIVIGGGAVALLAVNLWRAQRRADPAIPVDLFAFRTVRVGAALGFVASFAFFAQWLALLGVMTAVWGFSPTRAGFWLTGMPALMTVLAIRSGRLADRIGFKRVMVPTAVVYATGAALVAMLVGDRRNYALAALGVVIAGLGMAGIWPLLASIGTSGVPPHRVATAAALLQTVQRIGGSLGTAAVVVVVDAVGGSALHSHRAPVWMLAICGVVLIAIAALAIDRTRTTPVSG